MTSGSDARPWWATTAGVAIAISLGAWHWWAAAIYLFIWWAE